MRLQRLFIGLVASMFLSSAVAADLPSRYAAPAPQYIRTAPIFTWTGFYAGVTAGYGFNGEHRSAHENVNNFGGPGGTYGNDDLKGLVYGGHAGYNVQLGSFVLGAELGLNGSDLKGSDNYPQYFNDTGTKIDWYGTAALRAGFAFDRVLVFAKAGIAGGNVSLSQVYAPPKGMGAAWGETQFRTGYVLGAGLEYAVFDHLVLRAEYEYLNFGRKTYSSVDSANVLTSISNSANAHVGKVGLSYKF